MSSRQSRALTDGHRETASRLIFDTILKSDPKKDRESNFFVEGANKEKERHDTLKLQTRVSFSTHDRATRRVIAPYVKIIQKAFKPKISADAAVENKHFKYYSERKPSLLTKNLNQYLNDTVQLTSLMHETTDVLKETTNATGVILYLVDSDLGELVQSCRLQSGYRHRAAWQIHSAKTVAAYVALHKEFVMVDDVCADLRFPDGAGWKGPIIKSVLCVPVVTPENECLAVIELYKEAGDSPFSSQDLKIAVVVVSWMAAAIDQNTVRLTLQRQQELNDYLLNIVKCYFCDTMIINKMITEMVKYAKQIVDAERGYFFIIDREDTELTAEVFEEGVEPTGANGSQYTYMHKKKQKIRLAKDQSIAGTVARGGEMLNIKDAHKDPRFHNCDIKTSQTISRAVLCIPILGVTQVLGVIQMVNKLSGPTFTAGDETLLKTFATYCSLVLHYAKVNKLKEKINSERYIASDMCQFHMKPCLSDLEYFKEHPTMEPLPEDFDKFEYAITPAHEMYMPQLCLYMMQECIGYQNVVIENVMDLILTIKKSYRSNPYHNFNHAFSVFHCMYCILNRNTDLFTLVEREALMIAALCHDIDHQGYTNNFLRIVQDPIAELYEESPLEHHHYCVTMKILGEATCFNNMDATSYKELRSEIKDAIMATDLGNYFRYRSKLLPLVTGFTFDWENVNHRSLLKGIMMTSCDLSGMCKPVLVAKKLTDDLYREFYHQGDVEKAKYYTPLSMMDRDKHVNIPEDQVQFLSVVILPCVELLNALMPNTTELTEGCTHMRDTWRDIIDMRDLKTWVPEDSRVKPVESFEKIL